MLNPELYEPGMKNANYNPLIFFGYLIKASFIDAFVIFVVTYHVIGMSINEHGHEFGMVNSGATAYIASCLLADVWVMMRINQHSIGSTLSLVLMFIAPYFFYAIYSMGIIPLMGFEDQPIYLEFSVQFGTIVGLTYVFIICYGICTQIFRN